MIRQARLRIRYSMADYVMLLCGAAYLAGAVVAVLIHPVWFAGVVLASLFIVWPVFGLIGMVLTSPDHEVFEEQMGGDGRWHEVPDEDRSIKLPQPEQARGAPSWDQLSEFSEDVADWSGKRRF